MGLTQPKIELTPSENLLTQIFGQVLVCPCRKSAEKNPGIAIDIDQPRVQRNRYQMTPSSTAVQCNYAKKGTIHFNTQFTSRTISI